MAETRRVAAADLGVAGKRVDPTRAAEIAIAALAKLAAPGMALTSLTLEPTAEPVPAEGVTLSVRTDKQTRAVLFATCEAHAGDKLVFAARGLFASAE